jgi:hypothetical protein
VHGLLGLGTAPALLFAAMLVSGFATLIVWRLPAGRAIPAIGALLFLALLLQSQWIWRWQIDYTKQIRAQYPASLTWVNDNARGPVTRLYLFQNSSLFQTADFFNDDVDQVLVPQVTTAGRQPLGRKCPWRLDQRGVLHADACEPLNRRIWNDDPFLLLSFHGGRTIASDPNLGQIIAVPSQPRLRSAIRQPCQRRTLAVGRDGSPTGVPRNVRCTPYMSANLWVDSPGTFELTFEGGTRTQHVTYGERTWTLPANVRTTIRVPVNQAVASLPFKLDWDRSAGTPQIVGARFVTDAGGESLL